MADEISIIMPTNLHEPQCYHYAMTIMSKGTDCENKNGMANEATPDTSD